jgi:hypothetical protein
MVQWDKVLQVQVLVKQKVVLFLQAVLSSAYFNKKKIVSKAVLWIRKIVLRIRIQKFFCQIQIRIRILRIPVLFWHDDFLKRGIYWFTVICIPEPVKQKNFCYRKNIHFVFFYVFNKPLNFLNYFYQYMDSDPAKTFGFFRILIHNNGHQTPVRYQAQCCRIV